MTVEHEEIFGGNGYVCDSHSVMSSSLQPYGLQPIRLLCPWDYPGKNTGVGCPFLSRGSSQPRDRTKVSCTSCIGRWILYHCDKILYYLAIRVSWVKTYQIVSVQFINYVYLVFKYEFIYFNWRLITLQYCIGFAIHQHESATLPIPSLWVIPVHQPQASCILHRTWTGDSFPI